jgi:Phage Tail Protein X.
MPRAKYTTSLGDEWDAIAYRMYGTRGEMLMHLLLEANPDHRETVIFGSGVELTIPDAPNAPVALSAPWMRS